jgi:starch synthase
MEGLRDSAEKHLRKDLEIELADHVLVASTFTRESIRRHFGDSVSATVVPYGCPPPTRKHPAHRPAGEPLQIFYAGHLAQRKGIADLIAALTKIEIDWRLTLAGPRPQRAPRVLDEFLSDPRCKWIGVVPHETLLERMAKAHVFVFPSIVEGFGMVITEALSAGLPVITTPNTAGPDIMTHGNEGFITPIRDANGLAELITRLSDDENLRLTMAYAAMATATRRSWDRYEAEITKLVVQTVGP